jgi:hypothetical protein
MDGTEMDGRARKSSGGSVTDGRTWKGGVLAWVQSFEFRPKKMNFVQNSPISVGPGICTNRPKKFGPF